MNKLLKILMLSCKKASELIDKKSIVKLSVKESVMLKMHVSMCDACAAYQKQSVLLTNLLHKHINMTDENGVPHIQNESLKEKIISKMSLSFKKR